MEEMNSRMPKFSKFLVMINGRSRGKFKASRGLRQGDPLSIPFCLVCCYLGFIVEKSHKKRCVEILWWIGRILRYLIFKLQMILSCFSNGNQIDVGYMMSIVYLFCTASCLKINRSKSRLLGIKIDDSEVNWVANQWSCERGRGLSLTKAYH